MVGFEKSMSAQLPKDFLPLPEIHFEHLRGGYWIQNARGGWIQINETTVKRFLRQQGFFNQCVNGEMISSMENALLRIQREQDITYAGPLAGYQCGISEFSKNRILITSAPKIIFPNAGEFPIISQFLSGLLGEEQIPFLHGWLKIGFSAIRAGKYRPGQALVIAGERGCGKSLLQNLITEILGGRSAKPYRYMGGKTDFNGDLFGAEHLMIEDEAASTDIRSRRAFGSALKIFTVNRVQSCHGKNRQAISLEPIWRISVTVNDEPENLQILPPIEESIADKLILLKARRNQLPMPTGTQSERDLFWGTLVSELPAFLNYLEQWEIPLEQRCERFGIKHFHHSELLESLEMLSPEARLLALIDSTIFSDCSVRFWNGTAERLERTLKESNYREEATRLLSWNNATGTYLGRLANKYPNRFVQSRTTTQREWILYPTHPHGETERAENSPSGCHAVMTP
jgi:ABC-type dipeptide/oligopeptide/nickel transport system ATPase component